VTAGGRFEGGGISSTSLLLLFHSSDPLPHPHPRNRPQAVCGGGGVPNIERRRHRSEERYAYSCARQT